MVCWAGFLTAFETQETFSSICRTSLPTLAATVSRWLQLYEEQQQQDRQQQWAAIPQKSMSLCGGGVSLCCCCNAWSYAA